MRHDKIRLTQIWIEVRDELGRTRLEARWLPMDSVDHHADLAA